MRRELPHSPTPRRSLGAVALWRLIAWLLMLALGGPVAIIKIDEVHIDLSGVREEIRQALTPDA